MHVHPNECVLQDFKVQIGQNRYIVHFCKLAESVRGARPAGASAAAADAPDGGKPRTESRRHLQSRHADRSGT